MNPSASNENALKVVYPPRNPVTSRNRYIGSAPRASSSIITSPIANDPVILTANVPQGNVQPQREPIHCAMANRATAPVAPPSATQRYAISLSIHTTQSMPSSHPRGLRVPSQSAPDFLHDSRGVLGW